MISMQQPQRQQASTSHNVLKVLVVISDSSDSTTAVDNAINLVKSGLDAELYLLYVVEMEPLPPGVPVELERKIYGELREKGKRVIDEQLEKIRKAGIKANVLGMYFGIASEEILRVEKKLKPDFIVMRNRASRLRRLLSNNFAERIMLEAKTPILIAK